MSRTVSIGTLDEIVTSYINGNRKDALARIQGLSKPSRAAIVPRFRCLYSTQVAFEIADKIIRGDFK